MTDLQDHGPVSDIAKLHFTGHLAAQTRYPDGLRAILSEYFGLPVEIEEYVGQWLELPERSRMGVSANRLGNDLCLGRYVWDRQHKFRIRLGPLKLVDYMGMLPDGQPFKELVGWVAEYLGQELDWDLNLVLRQTEVPRFRLDGRQRLGFNTWLGRPEQDAKDLILARHYADQATTSHSSRSKEHG
jgi:type VI secretion system protein ImpH